MAEGPSRARLLLWASAAVCGVAVLGGVVVGLVVVGRHR